jgi:hypothetical protein
VHNFAFYGIFRLIVIAVIRAVKVYYCIRISVIPLLLACSLYENLMYKIVLIAYVALLKSRNLL